MARKDKISENKKQEAEKLLQYTYRDSGQEFIMKRKMLRAIVISLLAIIALIVFIALYISETYRVQETYRTQFDRALTNAISRMQDYEDADGDFELRYRMIFAEVTNLNTFSFLLNNKVEEHKRLNELYTVFLKYPEQVDARMPEIREILENINTSETKAYEELEEFVDSIDKMGN